MKQEIKNEYRTGECVCVCASICGLRVCVGEVSCRLLASRDTSEVAISRATHKVFNSI